MVSKGSVIQFRVTIMITKHIGGEQPISYYELQPRLCRVSDLLESCRLYMYMYVRTEIICVVLLLCQSLGLALSECNKAAELATPCFASVL